MEKMKLLTAILFCLGIAGMALAAEEVINIDLNAYGNDVAYEGYADTEKGTNVWRAYYGGSEPEGWGKPMGSPRSADLADYNDPCQPGTYAAQVWIGDNNATVAHDWFDGTGDGLMDDGFAKKPGGGTDPSIRLWGIDAYGGMGRSYDPNFDIYVLSAEDGNFTLTGGGRNETQNVDISGGNYAVFYDVNIGDDSNAVTISYDNVFNGLQLVKRKQPLPIEINVNDRAYIPATEYDVAYETNARAGDGARFFGPDIIDTPGDPLEVAYLDYGEYMEYDITVDDANAGQYKMKATVDTTSGDASMNVYLVYKGHDVSLGTLTALEGSSETNYSDLFSLFPGSHAIKWEIPGPEIYFNIEEFELKRERDVYVDCNEVYRYGWNDPNDFNRDCHVDFKDLAFVVDNWLNCYSPDPNDCL